MTIQRSPPLGLRREEGGRQEKWLGAAHPDAQSVDGKQHVYHVYVEMDVSGEGGTTCADIGG